MTPPASHPQNVADPDSAHVAAVMVDYLAFGLIVWVAPESGYLRGTGRPANAPLSGRRNPRRGGARGHRTTVISLDSALCLPLRVVLVEGRDEGKPGGLHDIRGRRPDRNPAARQLHLELDLSDRLAARAD